MVVLRGRAHLAFSCQGQIVLLLLVKQTFYGNGLRRAHFLGQVCIACVVSCIDRQTLRNATVPGSCMIGTLQPLSLENTSDGHEGWNGSGPRVGRLAAICNDIATWNCVGGPRLLHRSPHSKDTERHPLLIRFSDDRSGQNRRITDSQIVMTAHLFSWVCPLSIYDWRLQFWWKISTLGSRLIFLTLDCMTFAICRLYLLLNRRSQSLENRRVVNRLIVTSADLFPSMRFNIEFESVIALFCNFF